MMMMTLLVSVTTSPVTPSPPTITARLQLLLLLMLFVVVCCCPQASRELWLRKVPDLCLRRMLVMVDTVVGRATRQVRVISRRSVVRRHETVQVVLCFKGPLSPGLTRSPDMSWPLTRRRRQVHRQLPSQLMVPLCGMVMIFTFGCGFLRVRVTEWPLVPPLTTSLPQTLFLSLEFSQDLLVLDQRGHEGRDLVLVVTAHEGCWQWLLLLMVMRKTPTTACHTRYCRRRHCG